MDGDNLIPFPGTEKATGTDVPVALTGWQQLVYDKLEKWVDPRQGDIRYQCWTSRLKVPYWRLQLVGFRGWCGLCDELGTVYASWTVWGESGHEWLCEDCDATLRAACEAGPRWI